MTHDQGIHDGLQVAAHEQGRASAECANEQHYLFLRELLATI